LFFLFFLGSTSRQISDNDRRKCLTVLYSFGHRIQRQPTKNDPAEGSHQTRNSHRSIVKLHPSTPEQYQSLSNFVPFLAVRECPAQRAR
jgi:hypothetical protein